MGVIPYILNYSCLVFFFHLIRNQESFMLLHRGQPHSSLSWLHRIPGFS